MKRAIRKDTFSPSAPRGSRGITVLTAVLLCAVLAAAVLAAVPLARGARANANASECNLAIESAQRKIDEMTVATGGELSEEEARQAATQSMKDWNELCPGGGDCRLIPREDGGYTLVCALHCPDAALRVRLCAESALEQLRSAAERQILRGGVEPADVEVHVNGRPLTVRWVRSGDELSADGKNRADACFTSEDGQAISGFCYADGGHTVRWSHEAGWTEDGRT